jgi:LacI family transcriptional regulator
MKQIPRVILFVETSRAFGRGILTGIAKYSRLHGPWAFYREPGGLKSSIPKLKNWKPNGIITRDISLLEDLKELNIPGILILHEGEKTDLYHQVITDSQEIAKMAAEHLLSQGFKNFAFCGFDNFDWSNVRKSSFVNYLDEAGYHTEIFVQSKSTRKKKWEFEQEKVAAWLEKLPKPVGVFACNDDRGQHILEACKIAGLRVPEDVAVIGVDNDAVICELCDPPLTSISLDTEKAGYRIAELLDSLMQNNDFQGQEIIVAPTSLSARQSTDIMAHDDQELIKALRFIRLNIKNCISVEDVVKATALSRRTLEYRFRNKLNRSIKEYIRKERVRLISDMLIETELTVSEIAASLDFIDVEHISRFFKSEKGIGLRDFRKLHK